MVKGGGGGVAMGHANMETVTEGELRDMRQKFTLLEGDRKAYYEMSMHTMKENKKSIASIREGNKCLRKNLADLQIKARNNSKASGEVNTDKEFKALEKHVLSLRKNHDTLKSTVEDKRDMLRKLRDEAGALELEAKRPHAEDSPLTRKIRMLENRLDKAMIKYNEAASIRKTYEQIVKRLKEERIGFDNQLAAVERTLQAKQHDYDELLLLSGDANHAKDVSLQGLEKSRTAIAEARKQRERELKVKQEVVDARSDMVNRLEKREQIRNDIIAKANGDLSSQEEGQLKASLAINTLTSNKMNEDNKNQRAKIDIYEDAFRKIKDATGVSDVNEVIQKIISQEDTQRNLQDLTKENQDKIEQLKAEKQKLMMRVEEIKYSGTGGGHRRKMVDDHEESLAQSSAKLERRRLRYERLAKILINVKAGVNHLSDKLESVQQDNKHIVMNDDTVVDVLIGCENTLVTILNKINEDAGTESRKAELKNALIASFDDEEMAASRPFNQRINLPDSEAIEGGMTREQLEDQDGGDMQDMDMPMDDDCEEELTADRIKKASQTIIQSHEKKSRRGKRGSVSQGSAPQKSDSAAGAKQSTAPRRIKASRPQR